ncbi:dehydrogenase/reductase SDR family member 7B isoform X2 [Numenius arquata]|uniref:dehydrogenase/reductase SDR family member 7B isoform X2 n=1 Tax=Numenius arquata TaxID=31919 RepID=UPI003D309570
MVEEHAIASAAGSAERRTRAWHPFFSLFLMKNITLMKPLAPRLPKPLVVFAKTKTPKTKYDCIRCHIQECAKAFHAAGSKLVLCGRDSEKLKDLVQELSTVTNHRKNTHKPHTVVFDLSDTKTVLNGAEEILKYLGHVDILINNAGISFRGTIVDTGLDVDKKVMETNYFGPIALTKALLPSMIKRRQGHIVAISSVQGKISIPFRSAYAASKHATQAFFDCLRAEVEQYDIDVTVVSPGYIQTNLSLNAVTADGSRYGVMDKNTAEGQTAAEVAQVVLSAVGQKKKEVLVAGLTPSLAVYLRNIFPRLFFTLMATRAKKERKAKDS